MSHASHITNPSFLVYQFLAPPVKKKSEPKAAAKTAFTENWVESREATVPVRGRNHERQGTDDDDSGGRGGFDSTV